MEETRIEPKHTAITRQTWIELAALTLYFTSWLYFHTLTPAGDSPSIFTAFAMALLASAAFKLSIGVMGFFCMVGYENKVSVYNGFRYTGYAVMFVTWFANPDPKPVFSSDVMTGMLERAFLGFNIGFPILIVGIIKGLLRTTTAVAVAVVDGAEEELQKEAAEKARDSYLKDLQIHTLEQVSVGIANASQAEERIPCPMCAEKIMPAARICPFCKTNITVVENS